MQQLALDSPVIAMADPQAGGGLVTFLPFALILAIFYFLILMPMKRRQKKIQEFQQGLKVGDRVVTTSGIHGQITRVTDNVVQLQIADRVRIDVSRAAIGGYQGQEPVVPESGSA
jgi:preprotein translocase subunit YajC